jgi:hypothetical protein
MANLRIFRNIFVIIAQKSARHDLRVKNDFGFANLLDVFHGKSDAFFGDIERFDLDLHLVANGKHFAWVLDELFANF